MKIPDECIFNAREPSACEWYFTGLGLLADLMITSLGKAMPAKAVAANYGDSMVAAFVGADPRRPWIVIEPTAGGWGAWQGSDGESAMINLSNGSFRNIPAEVYEVKHPMKVEEFAIRKDSGGPGPLAWRLRGGPRLSRARGLRRLALVRALAARPPGGSPAANRERLRRSRSKDPSFASTRSS